MNAPGLDPLTKLHAALAVSERMRGVRVEPLGPRGMPLEAAPARVAMVPVGGELAPPDHSGNVASARVQVRFDALGRDYPQAHEVVRRILCAVEDYTREVGDSPADTTADGVADCLQWDGSGEVEYDPEPDTNRAGVLISVTLTLTVAYERTSRTADGGTGTVETVYITRAAPEEG